MIGFGTRHSQHEREFRRTSIRELLRRCDRRPFCVITTDFLIMRIIDSIMCREARGKRASSARRYRPGTKEQFVPIENVQSILPFSFTLPLSPRLSPLHPLNPTFALKPTGTAILRTLYTALAVFSPVREFIFLPCSILSFPSPHPHSRRILNYKEQRARRIYRMYRNRYVKSRIRATGSARFRPRQDAKEMEVGACSIGMNSARRRIGRSDFSEI